MNGRTPLRDAADRLSAATLFDRNIVVDAGAGTGKTSLLVERLLVALGSGRVRLHQVAAITFTEKAAGEMRERLGDGLESLRAIAAGEDRRPVDERRKAADRAYAFLRTPGGPGGPDGFSDEALRLRALEGLHSLDRATVSTVHGFCAEILRSFPFAAGVSPEFEIDRGERFAAAFPEAWEEFLAREFGPEGTLTALWSRVLATCDLGEVEEVARTLARSGIPVALLDDGAPWPDAVTLFGAEAAALADRTERLLGVVPKMGYKARLYLDEALAVLRALAERGLDSALRGRLGSDLLAGGAPDTNKTIPPERHREFRELVRETRTLLRPLADVDDTRVRDLVLAVAPFVRDFRETLVAAGFVDFDGLLARTRDVLRRNLAVREAVKARWSMLLVDEFQDTDPMQYEIVLHLAERPGGGAEDPFEADLEPGRLFIVGDPKQSVYRFRGADYAAYRRAVSRVIAQGGLPLALTANFRSSPEVLHPINDIFTFAGEGSWQASEYQPAYQAIDPVRESAGEEAGIELWSVLPAGASAPQRRDAEGRLVARRIRELRDEQGRSWKEFTILLRAFSDVSRYVRPLRDAGIPFVVTGGRTFHERTEVVRLLAHLRLLASPDDPPALLAWLRSPAGAVPDTELATWAASKGGWEREARPDPARWPNLARALNDLHALEEQVRDLPLDALVRRTLEASLLPIVEGFAFEGAQRVANLRKLAAQACDLARDGTLSLGRIVDALEERAGFEPEGESPLADENTDAVRLLTIHAAKGLEAPIVFLPDLARQEGARERDGVAAGVWHGPSGAALALKTRDGRSAARVALDLDNDRHQDAEGMRLLYVALTRARDRIVLLAGTSTRRGAPAWVSPLEAWGYRQDPVPEDGASLSEGRVIHRVLEGLQETVPTQVRAIAGAPAAAAAYTLAATALAERAAQPPLRSPSGLAEEIDKAHADGEGLAREAARAVGTAVHRLLERWRPGLPIAREAIVAACSAAAAERRCEASEIEREVAAILDRFESTPFVATIAGASLVMREIPVLRRDAAGTVWRGRADLLLREPDGGWIVVDFKTDAGIDATALADRYAPQIRTYALAVREALQLATAPRAQLWMLRDGTIVDVEI